MEFFGDENFGVRHYKTECKMFSPGSVNPKRDLGLYIIGNSINYILLDK